jgi:hypothetical protein
MTTKESRDDSSAVPGSIEARLLDAEARAKAITEEIRALYRESRAAAEADKANADDYTAEVLERGYQVGAPQPLPTPWEVHRIEAPAGRPIEVNERRGGKFVRVRPCGPEFAGKTYLGVYLGDMALSVGINFHTETRTAHIRWGSHNPAIFVPDLGRIVLGAESWWGLIKSPEDLQTISDLDIQSVWYVRALQALSPDKKE